MHISIDPSLRGAVTVSTSTLRFTSAPNMALIGTVLQQSFMRQMADLME